MSSRKRNGFIKITAVVIAIAFGITLFSGIAYSLFVSRDADSTDGVITDEELWLQQEKEIPVEELNRAGDSVKYATFSREDNIDIAVNYLSPILGTSDALVFEVAIGTHSVDMSKYKDLRDYVELRTDRGVLSGDDFEWSVQNSESHHIDGILKAKNSVGGNQLVGPDTKSLKLVFKGIGSVSEREHVYEGEKLK